MISEIFRVLGSSNLGFDYFQIFEYIQILEYIREHLLQIIFLFIFVTPGVKNNIHVRICIICLLQIIFIFVFVHQINYSLHSVSDHHAPCSLPCRAGAPRLISRQWMTSLDLCLPPGQGSQPRRRQPALHSRSINI